MTTEPDHILRTYIRALFTRPQRLLDIIRRGGWKITRSHVRAALPALRALSARPVATLKPEPKAPQQWRIGIVLPLRHAPGRAGHRSGDGPRVSVTPTARHIARMQEALDSLPKMTRAIFIAHCHDELTFETIAQRFGIPVCDVVCEISLALVALDGVDSEKDV